MPNNLFAGDGFFWALCLVVVIFLMPLFSCELRKSRSIIIGYWFVIFLHQIVAFLNAYLFSIGQKGTLGAEQDANRGYHLISKELASQGEMYFRNQNISVPLSLDSFLKAGSFYYEMLGSVYNWFGPSLLLGEQFSILAFALSCIVFLKIMGQLGVERYSFPALICFGALPSMVFLGSVTLRESYEIFFFMLTVYFGLRITIGRKLNIGSTFLMVVSALLMGVFHKALFIYTVFLVFVFFIWSSRPISRFGNIKKMHLIAMVIIPLSLLCIVVVSKENFAAFTLVRSLRSGIDLDQIITGWRGLSIKQPGRTSYIISLDPSSLLTLLFSGLKIYGYYLFAGFTWRIDNFIDAYATMEAVLRVTFLCFSVLVWWKAVGLQKRLLGLMLVLFFSMTILWALGTTNYGTAIRHHMLTWWIIVILGVPTILQHVRLGMMLRFPDSSVKISSD